MRPVNLLPPELRQGARAPMRTGAIPYILLGALVAALAGVALLVTTGNQISEKESEVAQLKREDAAARSEAKRLAPYVQFQALHEQRVTTISSLASSRFDWERVMREVALVLPHTVWLTELNASASADASTGGSGNLRSSVPGPALELHGCATGQEKVAGFVARLRDIDGVTRVGVEASKLSDQEEGAGSSEGESDTDSASCQTRKWIAKFDIVVAFDAAPIPATAGGVEAPTTEATETATSETSSSEGEEG